MTAGKYGPENTPYLETFHIVFSFAMTIKFGICHTVLNELYYQIKVNFYLFDIYVVSDCSWSLIKSSLIGIWLESQFKF